MSRVSFLTHTVGTKMLLNSRQSAQRQSKFTYNCVFISVSRRHARTNNDFCNLSGANVVHCRENNLHLGYFNTSVLKYPISKNLFIKLFIIICFLIICCSRKSLEKQARNNRLLDQTIFGVQIFHQNPPCAMLLRYSEDRMM